MFAILDKNVGMVQWISDADSAEAALADFDANVGIDPDGKGLDISEWKILDVSKDQADELREWSDNGCHGSECPAWL